MQRAILAESQSIYPLLETPAFTENVIRYVFHSAEKVPRNKTSPDAMTGSPLLYANVTTKFCIIVRKEILFRKLNVFILICDKKIPASIFWVLIQLKKTTSLCWIKVLIDEELDSSN